MITSISVGKQFHSEQLRYRFGFLKANFILGRIHVSPYRSYIHQPKIILIVASCESKLELIFRGKKK
ncbi:hypothetical protein ACMFMG_004134 [Clarireedia jacksonii]